MEVTAAPRVGYTNRHELNLLTWQHVLGTSTLLITLRLLFTTSSSFVTTNVWWWWWWWSGVLVWQCVDDRWMDAPDKSMRYNTSLSGDGDACRWMSGAGSCSRLTYFCGLGLVCLHFSFYFFRFTFSYKKGKLCFARPWAPWLRQGMGSIDLPNHELYESTRLWIL